MSSLHLPKVKGNAGSFVKHQGLLLAVKERKSHKWCIPSGCSEEGEWAHETAVRETYEETGLWVNPINLLFSLPNGEFFMYEASLKNYDIDISKPLNVPVLWQAEIEEARFLPISDLTLENMRFPNFLKIYNDFFQKVQGR